MDGRRLFQLGKHLSGRSHPFWHFGTGNLITLRDLPAQEGINTRDELIKFYHKYYSSSIMKLAIVGRGTYTWTQSISSVYCCTCHIGMIYSHGVISVVLLC